MGYKVSVLTCNDSLNAKKYCEFYNVIKKFSYKNIIESLKNINTKYSRKIILGSGITEMINTKKKFSKFHFLWNDPRIIFKLNDPIHLFTKLSSLGVKIPNWRKTAPKDGNYLHKDIRSHGGLFVSRYDKMRRIKPHKKKYFQQFIEGRNVSVQFFSEPGKFEIFSTCLQWNYSLSGRNFLLGGIVAIKLEESLMEKVTEVVKLVVTNFELVGINSIDFIISDNNREIYLIEINPRPGLSSKIICRKKLKKKIINFSSQIIYCQKDKFFSAQSIKKLPKISSNAEFTEVPFPGTFIKKNQPICLVHKEIKSLDSLKLEYTKIVKEINNI